MRQPPWLATCSAVLSRGSCSRPPRLVENPLSPRNCRTLGLLQQEVVGCPSKESSKWTHEWAQGLPLYSQDDVIVYHSAPLNPGALQFPGLVPPQKKKEHKSHPPCEILSPSRVLIGHGESCLRWKCRMERAKDQPRSHQAWESMTSAPSLTREKRRDSFATGLYEPMMKVKP